MGVAAFGNRYRASTDPLATERRVELVAVSISAILLLQLLYSGLRLSFLSEPEPIAPSLDLLAEGTATKVESVDPALSEEIRNRPLFWASRRPLIAQSQVIEGTVEGESAVKGELDKVQLVGIFGAGESAGIITLVKGKKRRILVGEDIDGWTLDSVEPGRAVFKDKGRSRELMLKPPAKKAKS